MLNHCYNSCSLRSYYGNTEILNISPNAAIYVSFGKSDAQNAELNSSVLIGEDYLSGQHIDLVKER